MAKRGFLTSGVVLIGLLTLVWFSSPAVSGNSSGGSRPSSHSELWEITQGGLLYDNWAIVQDTPLPQSTHPSYPIEGQEKGPTTWLCHTCHGWDYKGRDGVYGLGNHFTGIKGLRRMVGKPVEKIVGIIRDDIHQFSPEMISEASEKRLAAFLSRGQVDMDLFIDPDTNKALGIAQNGEQFYQSICAICHGPSGRAINLGQENAPIYLGTVANRNPWKALHKIRNGQPGAIMISFMTLLDVQDQLDILSHSQRLPRR
ncbi:MAG: c-type cytochrome [Magnetococcales bacterium]|nr:c-type cytochrome [Magnetococcales bacterium]